jgi:hypothetical protein
MLFPANAERADISQLGRANQGIFLDKEKPDGLTVRFLIR